MRKVLVVLAALSLTAAACGSDEAGLEISGAWARTSPRGTDIGAGYLVMESPVDDELVGATTDIAARVELHEVVMADMAEGDMSGDMGEMSDDEMSEGEMSEGEMGDDMSGGMDDMSGAMVMQQVATIALPAGETVTLEPGGYHLMFIDLVAPLEVGQSFTVTLTFAEAGEREVTFEVRDSAP